MNLLLAESAIRDLVQTATADLQIERIPLLSEDPAAIRFAFDDLLQAALRQHSNRWVTIISARQATLFQHLKEFTDWQQALHRAIRSANRIQADDRIHLAYDEALLNQAGWYRHIREFTAAQQILAGLIRSGSQLDVQACHELAQLHVELGNLEGAASCLDELRERMKIKSLQGKEDVAFQISVSSMQRQIAAARTEWN